jgi:hypothetical protein
MHPYQLLQFFFNLLLYRLRLKDITVMGES